MAAFNSRKKMLILMWVLLIFSDLRVTPAQEDGIIYAPFVKLGPMAGKLKVAPGMNAAGKNLWGSEFSACDLHGASFDGCALDGVVFEQCNLRNASFKGANLNGADFRDCDLKNVCFDDAILNGMPDGFAISPDQLKLTYSYRVKDLSHCGIVGYRDASAKYDFRNANLTNANLWGGDLSGSDFTDANIEEASFAFCTMTFSQLSSTKTFKDRNLRHMTLAVRFIGPPADFTGIDLTGTHLHAITMREANFTNATITGCTFHVMNHVQLYSTKNYQQGDLSKITFLGLKLMGWDLSRQNLTGCRFSQCDLTGTQLKDAVITDVHFTDLPTQEVAGLTLEQIKSTWNYKHGRMAGIVLPKELTEALKNDKASRKKEVEQ